MGRKLIHTAGKVARPEGAGVLTTYDQLRAKAKAFAAGKYILLTICGSSGIGKTKMLKKALEGQEYGYIKGNAAPFGLYCEAFKCRNMPLLIDDADPLTKTESGKRLLKALCDTEGWRHVSWQTATLLNKKNAPAPAHFWTNSKLCILTNEWYLKEGDVHSEAVGDRGATYLFAPTALEIHRYTATWFWDQEIFDAVARHLPYIRSLTCRLYYRAWQEKNAGEKWMDMILSQIFTEEDMEWNVLELMEKLGQDTKSMCKTFIDNGYGSRATFYRYYKDLSERYKLKTVEHIQVQGKPPQDEPDPTLMEMPEDGDDGDDENDDGDDDDEMPVRPANTPRVVPQVLPLNSAAAKKHGRAPKVQPAAAKANPAPKRRGRPSKKQVEGETVPAPSKTKGKKAQPPAPSKKRARPPKVQPAVVAKPAVQPRKRGRPPKEQQRVVGEKAVLARKKPKDESAQPPAPSKKRGRPPKKQPGVGAAAKPKRVAKANGRKKGTATPKKSRKPKVSA